MSEEIKETEKAEVEFGGVKLSGSKILLLLPVLSALGGALWGGFEFYKDYMNMKEQIQAYVAPDISGVEKRASLAEQKAIDSVDYTRDIKSSLQNDILGAEDKVDRLDSKVGNAEEKLKIMLDRADMRFEAQRTRLQSENKGDMKDLEDKINSVKTKLEAENRRDMKELEDRLNRKIQQALDNPLSK